MIIENILRKEPGSITVISGNFGIYKTPLVNKLLDALRSDVDFYNCKNNHLIAGRKLQVNNVYKSFYDPRSKEEDAFLNIQLCDDENSIQIYVIPEFYLAMGINTKDPEKVHRDWRIFKSGLITKTNAYGIIVENTNLKSGYTHLQMLANTALTTVARKGSVSLLSVRRELFRFDPDTMEQIDSDASTSRARLAMEQAFNEHNTGFGVSAPVALVRETFHRMYEGTESAKRSAWSREVKEFAVYGDSMYRKLPLQLVSR